MSCSLMFGCLGRWLSTCISAAMDSVMASSCDLSIILTAYSIPVSRQIHFLTVLDRPLMETEREGSLNAQYNNLQLIKDSLSKKDTFLCTECYIADIYSEGGQPYLTKWNFFL